jgi:hypothetical protein
MPGRGRPPGVHGSQRVCALVEEPPAGLVRVLADTGLRQIAVKDRELGTAAGERCIGSPLDRRTRRLPVMDQSGRLLERISNGAHHLKRRVR